MQKFIENVKAFLTNPEKQTYSYKHTQHDTKTQHRHTHTHTQTHTHFTHAQMPSVLSMVVGDKQQAVVFMMFFSFKHIENQNPFVAIAAHREPITLLLP